MICPVCGAANFVLPHIHKLAPIVNGRLFCPDESKHAFTLTRRWFRRVEVCAHCRFERRVPRG